MQPLTRKQFVNSLIKKARKDKDIILLTGDLGFSFFEPFYKEFPDRFINCGVIEQSMIGIACGLALAGKKPYVYSTATFLIFRALEQIRNDIGYQKLKVVLVGASKQLHFLGYTHSIRDDEDLKVLEAIGGKIKYIRLT
jgi:transketolase